MEERKIVSKFVTKMKQSFIIMLLTLMISVSEAQTFYPLDVCKWSYEQRAYETILPSLLHIMDVAENGDKFDAAEYFGAAYLLCNIYTHHYKNPEYSVNVMERAYHNIERNADSTHICAEAAVFLIETYLTTNQFDKAQKIIQNVDVICNKVNCICDLRLIPKLEYSIATKDKAKITLEIKNLTNYYQEKKRDIFKENDYISIDRLAAAYHTIGDTAKAEQYWQYILDNLKINSTQYNTLFNSVINSLAMLQMQRHQWHEALALYDRVKMFNDYYNVDYYKNILICALAVNDLTRIKKYYTLFSKEMVDNKSRIFFKSTEEKHYATWLETSKDIDLYNYAALKSQYAPAIADAFASNVFFKNLSVNSNVILSEHVNKSGLKNLIAAYGKCQKLKQDFVFGRGTPQTRNEAYNEYERLYDSILTLAPRFTQKMWNQMKSFGEMLRPLFENEYVIEFCLIPDYGDYPNHTDYFGAYIIGKNFSVPKLVKLCETKDIEKILTPTQDDSFFYSQLYTAEKSKQLYNLIFKPLESTLRNARKIYYSPYGILANINFDCLADDNGQYLCNKTNLVRVSSVAQIAQVKSRSITAAPSVALFGNIDYKTYQNTPANAVKRDIDFINLPFTKIEIDSIVKILNAHNIAVKTYEQISATEESFKRLSGKSPDILHLATHGFCLDTKEKAANKPFAQSVKTFSQKESAMALSGLALSGANIAWKGNFDLPNVEDGILTAYEISQLDLSNTKLVVLSACETARGKIFPVDGVLGLQRAFKQASVGSILMSLWKVDDNATALFMQHFYKFLFETNDRHKALKMAQDEVKKQFPDPYYWAAWVMLD